VTAPKFSEVQAIFGNRYCVGCHSGSGTQLSQVFKVNSHAALLEDSIQCTQAATPRKRVKPGDAANSYLVHKVRGVMLCAGVKMPQAGTPLTEAEIKTIEDWINAGAKMD
jgi:hypothetical protein